MSRFRRVAILAAAALLVGGLAFSLARETTPMNVSRADAQKMYANRNYKDAYEAFSRLALDPAADSRQVGADLNMALECLQQLNRASEIDPFRERVIAVHPANWRLLHAAAQSYMNLDHFGFMIAGKFERGRHRGGGQVVSSAERDRVRALQLMVQAMPLAERDDERAAVSQFFFDFGQMLLNNRGFGEAWRLQALSDLDALPDYEQGWGYGGGATAAPVDPDGNPVYHKTPKSFEAAQNDGERWRWSLEQAIEMDPNRRNQVRYHFAQFLQSQFGVETLASFGIPFGRMAVDDTKKEESGTYALHTLGENETIARLATGIKRFTLPDEFNFLKIFQEIAADPRKPYSEQACVELAQFYENRRQYPKAAEAWQRCLREHPGNRPGWQQRLDQIVKNWGRFEPVATQAAGGGATVDYRFRNGREVKFTAREIDVAMLLDDVKAYIKSRPNQLDHRKLDVGNIGHRLVSENEKKYVTKTAATWTTQLEPRANHFDRRITVTTPLTTPGAYLLTAEMRDGNQCHIVLWVADTAIVKKPLDQKAWFFVGDAVTGKPIPKANVEFFGFRQEQRQPRRFDLLIKQFAEYTDADGQLALDQRAVPDGYQWIVIARAAPRRFAFLGYTNIWFGQLYDEEYNQTRVYTITDRPVYRPGQKVHYKAWLRHAKYDMPETSEFAGRGVAVEIYDAKNERVVNNSVTLDPYGGVEGELDLPEDASLGVWRLNIVDMGGGTFRVEEYKKPEFEVTVDAPAEPVMLGDRIEAKIKAKYYFGSPVTQAKVKYKVMRSAADKPWYPARPWDWFYGPGYWWFAHDYRWYPGFAEWGCFRPMPFWWPRAAGPPEIVAQREVEIGPDGTLKVEIDTLPAKEIHPDKDHEYTITAEVVDQSRRTIVGTGSVLVARKPFKVYAWIDRGYYRVGDTIDAHFSARTLDSRPVEAAGEAQLLAIRYRDGKPVETPVFTSPISTDAQGMADLKLKAAAPGQYRLACKLTDKKEHTIEGGYIFTVRGETANGSDFRYNAIELIPEKAEYRPGEIVRLMVSTDRLGGTVLLFVRPSNGVYLPPRVVRLDGKSTVEEIAVAERDMPNFFVEAVTLADGRVHTETKEIVVPPVKRVVNVEVLPSAAEYLPGQKAGVRLRLTDFDGKPFHGSTVVAVYDKSVEYISGGSNVPEIREFFWKWRRQHNETTESSLDRFGGNLVPPKTPGMRDVGIFGATSVDDLDSIVDEEVQTLGPVRRRGGMAYGMGMGGFGGAMNGRAMPAMARMEKAAPMAAAPMAMAEGAPMMDLAAAPAPAGAAPGEALPGAAAPTIRSAFADTAFWVGRLDTKEDGTAEVSLTMPENLTTWRVKCWAMGHGTRVGQGTADVVTRKNLILRMQAPRFFIEKDEVVLSANVHNYLETKKSVQVKLQLEGDQLAPLGQLEQTVAIEPEGEARVDWRVKVAKEGEAVVRMFALADEESDAMEMRFPCYVHGMLKMEAVSGAIRPEEGGGKFSIRVPAERRPDQTRLEVRYSPTLAGAMVDALPYLVDYPYGCTEQTLNRFLPTVITQKILLDMRLDLKAIQEKRTNLNAQEIGDDAERAKRWQRYDRNPVFDEDEVRRMVKEGVNRLVEMQLSDGGWGWFSGYGEYPSAHTTAVVVHGLQIAVQNDVALVPGVVERGVDWLKRYQDSEVQKLNNALKEPKQKPWKEHADNLDALVYMVLVDAGVKNSQMLDFLYRDRPQLAVYSLATFGLALERQGEKEKLAMVLRNIEQYLVEDDENQTAWLNLPDGAWWYWYGSEYEAHAYYLKLLARTDPKGRVASRLVKYLLNNRKHATYWNSTRDTALCIEAMAEFMRASGEARPEMTVEVWLDGKLQKAVEITPANLFQFDNKLVVEGAALADGDHTIELKKKGAGPLYYNAYLTNFTLEDPIAAAGLEIKVERKYYRLKEVEKSIKVAGSRGQAVDQRVEKYDREPLADLSLLKSGELVEIELEIASKNDYEYVVFEDMKAAGLEPVDLRSGYTGNALGAYVEFRDNRVVLFVNQLARGNHSVAYRMRAEIPGRFSALPAKAWAMYAPELKANSSEMKLLVED